MSTERLPFTTDAVPEINAHLQERLKEVEANLASEAYPKDKPREINLKIVFQPDKDDPEDLMVKVFSSTKLPKRFGKAVPAVVRNGEILVDRGPEDVPLFPRDTVQVEITKAAADFKAAADKRTRLGVVGDGQ